MRVCEKLEEMQKELEEGSGSTDLRSSADAEQFRRELALRLDRLTRGGDTSSEFLATLSPDELRQLSTISRSGRGTINCRRRVRKAAATGRPG